MRLNDTPGKLKIGDLVTTGYRGDEKDVVRKITLVEKNERYGSGYMASADGGLKCRECGRSFGQPINGVDASWFIPVWNKPKEAK